MARRLSRRALLMGGTAGLLAACSLGYAGNVPYSAGVSGDGNSLTIQRATSGTDGYVVAIQSARGIGQATVAWWGTAVPHRLYFHLELTVLELFSLRWHDQVEQVVNLSIGAGDRLPYVTALDAAGHDIAVTAESALWMEATPTSGDVDGYVVAAPRAFNRVWPPIWSIAWVDYFR